MDVQCILMIDKRKQKSSITYSFSPIIRSDRVGGDGKSSIRIQNESSGGRGRANLLPLTEIHPHALLYMYFSRTVPHIARLKGVWILPSSYLYMFVSCMFIQGLRLISLLWVI